MTKKLMAIEYALVNFRAHLLGSKPFVFLYRSCVFVHCDAVDSSFADNGLLALIKYNFEMKHEPNNKNVPANALSRRPDHEHALATTVASSITDLIRAAYAKNDHCINLLRAVGSERLHNADIKLSTRLRTSFHQCSIDQGLLSDCTDATDSSRFVVSHDVTQISDLL